ncbi:MAG TPA: ABC transporter substrate-binding protein [Nitrococcus sp.]|nr:ABC transporter substrate-binding protein [Nitrococcus sp.]
MSSTGGRGWIWRIAAPITMLWLAAVINLPALAAAKIVPPDQLVKQTTQEVLQLLQEHRSELKAHPAQIYEQIKGLVIKHFDFPLMSRFVLAQNWRQASPAQRERFVQEFRRLLVQTYGYSLSQYSGQTVDFKGMQPSPSNDRTIVKTVIKQPDGPDIPVDYRLHRTSAGWKVYDVILDGVSLVQNYRSSFNAQIHRDGMDRFLDQLQQRNEHPAH